MYALLVTLALSLGSSQLIAASYFQTLYEQYASAEAVVATVDSLQNKLMSGRCFKYDNGDKPIAALLGTFSSNLDDGPLFPTPTKISYLANPAVSPNAYDAIQSVPAKKLFANSWRNFTAITPGSNSAQGKNLATTQTFTIKKYKNYFIQQLVRSFDKGPGVDEMCYYFSARKSEPTTYTPWAKVEQGAPFTVLADRFDKAGIPEPLSGKLELEGRCWKKNSSVSMVGLLGITLNSPAGPLGKNDIRMAQYITPSFYLLGEDTLNQLLEVNGALKEGLKVNATEEQSNQWISSTNGKALFTLRSMDGNLVSRLGTADDETFCYYFKEALLLL